MQTSGWTEKGNIFLAYQVSWILLVREIIKRQSDTGVVILGTSLVFHLDSRDLERKKNFVLFSQALYFNIIFKVHDVWSVLSPWHQDVYDAWKDGYTRKESPRIDINKLASIDIKEWFQVLRKICHDQSIIMLNDISSFINLIHLRKCS